MKRTLPDLSVTSAGESPYTDPTFSADIIRWQRAHGRHTLPWQQTQDAYRIWLSEIMLQQTQVAAVIPYYQRFLASFPTVNDLAAAPSEAVMAHWSGLGYYTRARNLHRCAQIVAAEHGGQFPASPDVLATLPGIGRSTAAAIAAFAYGCRAAIMDGNVKRVFARVFGVEGYPGVKQVETHLWERAVALLPDTGIESYTQGLMDMGATICTRSSTACERCPLSQRCVAYRTDRVAELPHRKPKKAIPDKFTVMAVVRSGDSVLLEQRPEQGIWGGLVSLPDAGFSETDVSVDTIPARLSACDVETDRMGLMMPFTHVFTHFRLHVQPVLVCVDDRNAVQLQAGMRWHLLETIGDAPLPAPVKKLLLQLEQASRDLLSV